MPATSKAARPDPRKNAQVGARPAVPVRLISTAAIRALAIVALFSASAFAQPSTPWLLADFEDQPVDQPIGTGGAALGQPYAVSGLLSAIVRDTPMASRSLELAWAGAPSETSNVYFSLVDGVEVASGLLEIEMTLHPHRASTYWVLLREAGTAMRMFGGLTLTETGVLMLMDATGTQPAAIEVPFDSPLQLRWLYHLDNRSYDFWLNGERLVTARPHGVPDDGRGIGQVMVGLNWNTPADTRLSLDELRVQPFIDAVFANGFETGNQRQDGFDLRD